jgi:hypothetical protein
MYSRKHFLSFPGKSMKESIVQICLGVNRDICRATALGHTSYMYQPRFAAGGAGFTNDDLVEALQGKFPHCLVEGRQFKDILIDWS